MMKSIKASLRLLYQNREMWAWYFILAMSVYHILSSLPTPQSPPTSAPVNNWALISPNLVLAVLGCAMGRIASGIWTKPVFFCVPGQIGTTRRMLVVIGLLASSATSLIMTTILPWLTFSQPEMQVALFGFYLMIYSLSLIISIRFNKIVFFIPYFILFFMQLMNRLEILSFIQNLLLAHPWISALICWSINCLVYYAVGTKYLPRLLCGMPSAIFFPGMESPGSNVYHRAGPEKDTLLKRVPEKIRRFFLARIRSHNDSSVAPNVWGRIYVILGSFISNWRVIFFDGPIIFLSAAILINSIRVVELQSFLYGFIGLFGGHICVVSGSDIFLPLDRRGRFFSEIAALATAIAIMFALAALFNLLSVTLPHSITSFINLNWSSEFISLNVKYIFFTMILLPITGGLLILIRKRSFLSILSVTGIAIFLLGAHNQLLIKGVYALGTFNLFTLMLMTIVSFGFYLAVIFFDSFRQSFR